MKKKYQDILKETELYIKRFYKDHATKDYKFHNINHTCNVVKAANKIIKHEKISEDEKFIINLACYFHDTGYYIDLRNHEEKSKEIALDFLNQYNLEATVISSIINCIEATKMPQNPQNQIEKIVCDADLYHLSTEDFLDSSYRLYKEWDKLGIKKLKKNEYLNISLKFMIDHTYFTAYGQQYLEEKKNQNIRFIQTEIEQMQKQKERKEMEKTNIKQLSSGISSMFRITGRMQINLSSMADSKSSLLISVNAIMISLIVSYILGNANHNLLLIIPTLILLITSLTTIILSIMAARPTISSGRFTREDIENRKVNLLFFGNFYKMSLDEYDWAVREMMKDSDYLYGNMIRDQYSLGLVLAKKYRWLRAAFNIFMGGLILASIAFIIMLVVA